MNRNAKEQAMRMMEEAMVMDSESEEYLKVKKEVEAFIYFRPDAKVDDFMNRYMELHEDANPFLPLMVVAKLNEERDARKAMRAHIGNLDEALKAFKEVRENASPKTFFEEYRVFDPTITKEAVIEAVEKLDDELGDGRVITELWIDKPLGRAEAKAAGKEAVAVFGKNHPEAAEFIKAFHYKVSDLSVEDIFGSCLTVVFDKDEVEEILFRKLYENSEELIEHEQQNLMTRFIEWSEAYC